jgi:hypothetical protein
MKINTVDFAKTVLRRAGDFQFHRYHRAQATSVLKALEAHLGKTNRADLRRADAYARDVLGHSCYAPWLYVYSAIAGRFKEGWIPDNYYGRIVVPNLKGGYGKTSNLKALQYATFGSDAFPDVAYFVNGLFVTPTGAAISPDSLARHLFAHCDSLVFKIDDSFQGKGIFFFDRSTFDVQNVKALGNGVFQKRIVQHELLARFAPRSVATVRITTAVNDAGVASVRACYLRLGRNTDTHVQSSSHVRVRIDCTTGELAEDGYLANWTVTQAHPDSNVPFAGAKIPAFDDCLRTVLKHHSKVPFVRCIGWDVAIDHDGGVQLMEWNGVHNDIKFSEATQGPCFADLGWDRLAPKTRGKRFAFYTPETRYAEP